MGKQHKPKPVKPFRLGFLVHDVSRLRRTAVDKALKPLGVTRSQWWVLANLSRHSGGSMMQTELAKVLDVGKVALGGLLDRLESNDYIVRTVDATDRRAKRIDMTPRALELLAGIEERVLKLNADMVRDITPEEIMQTEDILHRMKKRLILMESASRSGQANASVVQEDPQLAELSPA